jgi:hypothetical protein
VRAYAAHVAIFPVETAKYAEPHDRGSLFGMSPDARKESPPLKFCAVLPPELEGVDLEEGGGEPVPCDVWDADVDARLEAEWAKQA